MPLHLVGETIDKVRSHYHAGTGKLVQLMRGVYVDATDDPETTVFGHAVRIAREVAREGGALAVMALSAVALTASNTRSSSRISTWSGRHAPPAASIAAAAVWMVPGSFACGSTVFAAMATLAPSSAARSAISRPMPRLPPLMKSVFPLRLALFLPFARQ